MNLDPVLSVRATKHLASNGHRFSLDVDLSLPAGITILFGPSGSGKTTILQCIAGLVQPERGRIVAGDSVLFDSEQGIDLDVPQRAIGYVFQELALFPHLTVEQNVQYGLGKLSPEARRERTAAILGSFHVSHLLHAYPKQISGGERQRVALARALVTMPRVLLLDEPLSGLDAPTKNQIIEDLRAWNEAWRIPILYVTHSRREVFALGERVVCLDDGKVLAEGVPHEVLNEPRHETVAQLAGFENVFDATVTGLRPADGIMTCKLAGGSSVELEVPYSKATVGARVRFAVRAGDILLATQPPSFLSARNVIPGRLARIDRAGTLAVAKVCCEHAEFSVNLTPNACESLGLFEGQDLWLVIKTHSCHLVEERGDAGRPRRPAEEHRANHAVLATATRPGADAAPRRSYPRLKVLYLLAVTALAFAIPAFSATQRHRWQLVPVLLVVQVLLLLQARVSLADIARGALRLKWLFVFLLAMYTFLPSDTGGVDEIVRWTPVAGWRSIAVNVTGFAIAAMMCLQLMTVVLVSAVVRLTGSGTDLVDGLRGFGLPKLFVYSVDYTLALMGGIRRKGMGGGMGGGRGRHRDAAADAEKGPGLLKVLKGLLHGDVGVFTSAVHDSLARAQVHIDQLPGEKLDSDVAHDVAVITGISFMMMSLKIMKILPGIPFFSGFKTLLLYPLYFLAADLTRSRWGGTVCGTIMGVIGFMQGDGRYGAFEILKHAAPGLVIDLTWPLVKRLPRSMIVFCAVGFVAAIARTTTEFATVLLLRPRDEVLLFPFFKLIPNLVSGTLSGMITYFVLPAFHASRAPRASDPEISLQPGSPMPAGAEAPGEAVVSAPAGSMGAGGGGGRGAGVGGGRGSGMGRGGGSGKGRC